MKNLRKSGIFSSDAINEIVKTYKKYKWFFTSSGKLAVGGKSAEQNDEILSMITDSGKEYFVMHTSHPGSPFSIILSNINAVDKEDLEECAVFTGCFSRAWKEGKKKTEIHIFKSSQLEKTKGMKTGSWKVNGKIERKNVGLKLALIKQKGKLRAVPLKSVKGKEFLIICPGGKDKEKIADELIKKIKEKSKAKIIKEDLLAALPAGGIRTCQ